MEPDNRWTHKICLAYIAPTKSVQECLINCILVHTHSVTHTHQDIVEGDLRDEPYLRMEHDAAKPYI